MWRCVLRFKFETKRTSLQVFLKCMGFFPFLIAREWFQTTTIITTSSEHRGPGNISSKNSRREEKQHYISYCPGVSKSTKCITQLALWALRVHWDSSTCLCFAICCARIRDTGEQFIKFCSWCLWSYEIVLWILSFYIQNSSFQVCAFNCGIFLKDYDICSAEIVSKISYCINLFIFLFQFRPLYFCCFSEVDTKPRSYKKAMVQIGMEISRIFVQVYVRPLLRIKSHPHFF